MFPVGSKILKGTINKIFVDSILPFITDQDTIPKCHQFFIKKEQKDNKAKHNISIFLTKPSYSLFVSTPFT